MERLSFLPNNTSNSVVLPSQVIEIDTGNYRSIHNESFLNIEDVYLTPKCPSPFLSFLEFAQNLTKSPSLDKFYQFKKNCKHTNSSYET